MVAAYRNAPRVFNFGNSFTFTVRNDGYKKKQIGVSYLVCTYEVDEVPTYNIRHNF